MPVPAKAPAAQPTVSQISVLESALSAAADRVAQLRSALAPLEVQLNYVRIAAVSSSLIPQGIENVGNTCYANALLQALSSLGVSNLPLLSRTKSECSKKHSLSHSLWHKRQAHHASAREQLLRVPLANYVLRSRTHNPRIQASTMAQPLVLTNVVVALPLLGGKSLNSSWLGGSWDAPTRGRRLRRKTPTRCSAPQALCCYDFCDIILRGRCQRAFRAAHEGVAVHTTSTMSVEGRRFQTKVESPEAAVVDGL